MKRLIIMFLISMAVVGWTVAQTMTGAPAMSGANDSTMAPADTSGMMAAPDKGGMASSDASMKADPMMGSELRMAKSTGMKVLFKNLSAAETLAKKNPTVLFFAADWCPYCQADLKDINANGSSLGKVNVVVVDYDKSAELKTKYGITAQDTYVQIDSKGAKLAVWNGGGVDGILKNLVKPM
jgi:thiol-disulfide isomerase/thioredoxin